MYVLSSWALIPFLFTLSIFRITDYDYPSRIIKLFLSYLKLKKKNNLPGTDIINNKIQIPLSIFDALVNDTRQF